MEDRIQTSVEIRIIVVVLKCCFGTAYYSSVKVKNKSRGEFYKVEEDKIIIILHLMAS